MVRLIIFASLVAVALTIYSMIDCARTERHKIRSLPKSAWLVIILLLPLVGAGLWYLLGRPYTAHPGAPAPRSQAPDDDEDFLRQLEIWRRQQQRETELNQRESEIKKQEADKPEKPETPDKPQAGEDDKDEPSDNATDPKSQDG